MPDQQATPLRVGFIGCGGHATQTVLPSLRYADVDLRAVCDMDRDRAAFAARKFGAATTYTDVSRMLESEELDLVAVVGPAQLHVEAGLQALESGRHLFVEKPPGLTRADAEALSDAAGKAERHVGVGFQKRHARSYLMAKRIVTSPEFGEPTQLRLNYSHWKYAPTRDHLAFMSVHALDLARFFLGDVVAGSLHKNVVDGQAVLAVTLEHERGATSVLTLSALEPRVQESLEIAGRSTLLRVRDLVDLTLDKAAPDFIDSVSTDETMTAAWRPDFTIPIAGNDSLTLQGYAGQMQSLVRAIRSGSPVSPDISDGIAAMTLVDAIDAAPTGISILDLG
jgi:predicted dehydrogenase